MRENKNDCLTHWWLNFLEPLNLSFVWQLRALPALFGAGVIMIVYFLNSPAFSRVAGLFWAAIMAFSPFGVYLGQEAHHHILATLFITIALFALIKVQKDLLVRKESFGVRLLWGIVNSLGLYIHREKVIAVLFIEILSSLFVVYNLAFLKPFFPEQVAQIIEESQKPTTVVFADENENDIALG